MEKNVDPMNRLVHTRWGSRRNVAKRKDLDKLSWEHDHERRRKM